MSIPRQLSVLALSAVLVAGCRDKSPELPRMSEAMPNLPLPPQAAVVSRSGSADAIEITFKSSYAPDSMAAYYRRVLTNGEWSLVSDNRATDGTITLYAERNGPPLWVTIRKDPESAGTIMTLGGAVTTRPDSTAPDSSKTT